MPLIQPRRTTWLIKFVFAAQDSYMKPRYTLKAQPSVRKCYIYCIVRLCLMLSIPLANLHRPICMYRRIFNILSDLDEENVQLGLRPAQDSSE